jgi:hypothetical protein
MVTLPLRVPAASPEVFTETVRLPGVVVPFGTTVSQGVAVEAEKVRALPVLPTLTVCELGTVPPMVKLKVNDDGDVVRPGNELTVKLTGTTTGLLEAPVEATVMDPL